MVSTLIAAVQKAARWIKGEAARVVATRPFLGDVAKRAVRTDGKDADAVVKAVTRVNEAAIRRDEDLGAEIAARIAWREAGKRLPVRKTPALHIEYKSRDRGALLLNAVKPATIRMKGEVTRTIARRQRDEASLSGCEDTFLAIELPHEDLIEPEIDMHHPLPGRIGLDHVRMRLVVPTDGKTARRSVSSFRGTDLTGVLFHIGSLSEATIRLNGQNGHAAAEIVRHKHELAIRMHGEMRRAFATGTDAIEQLQMPRGRIDFEGTDTAGLVVTEAFGFVTRVEMRLRRVQREATRAGAHFNDAQRREFPGGAVHFEQMNTLSVARRQINLRGPHVLQRRGIGANIGDEPALGRQR